ATRQTIARKILREAGVVWLRDLRLHYGMKAIRLIKSCSLLEAREIAIPPIGECDVLIQITAAGICHSDAHYRAGVSPVEPLPLTLGHEVTGTVEKVGAKVGVFRVGDRVCV